ncbi:MAG: hypothetical protein QOE72_3806 [Chloroflexota bacterium]|jgi:hypothetical protein|nr:hypothetical protein [Chloroflexota bacterium]
MGIRYFAIADSRDPAKYRGIFMENRGPGVLDLVGWSWPEKAWVEDSELARYLLTDRADRTVTIDRATAERLARDVLGATLPTEKELRELVDAQRARRKKT